MSKRVNPFRTEPRPARDRKRAAFTLAPAAGAEGGAEAGAETEAEAPPAAEAVVHRAVAEDKGKEEEREPEAQAPSRATRLLQEHLGQAPTKVGSSARNGQGLCTSLMSSFPAPLRRARGASSRRGTRRRSAQWRAR